METKKDFKETSIEDLYGWLTDYNMRLDIYKKQLTEQIDFAKEMISKFVDVNDTHDIEMLKAEVDHCLEIIVRIRISMSIAENAMKEINRVIDEREN